MLRPTTSSVRQTPFMALLALTMVIAAIVIPSFGVLAPFLREDLGISRTQLGWLVAVVAFVSATTSPLVGRLTDRLGGRRLVMGVFGGGLLACLWMALSPSYVWLFGAALLGGLANACGNPATNKLIAAHMKPGARGLVIGVKQSGVQAGIFFSGVALPPTAVAFGWRTAALLVCVVALLGIVGTLRVVPVDRSVAVPDEDQSIDTHEVRSAYRHSSLVRVMTVYALLMGGGTAAMTAFLPLYVAEGVGLGATAGGAAAAVMGLTGVVSRIVVGRATEHVTSFLVPLAWLATVAVLATFVVWAATLSPLLIWFGAFLAGIGVMAWNAVAMLAVVVRVHHGHAGRATGMVFLGFMIGYTLSPVAIGAAVDVTGAWTLGWMAALVLFATAALLAVATRRFDVGTPQAA